MRVGWVIGPPVVGHLDVDVGDILRHQLVRIAVSCYPIDELHLAFLLFVEAEIQQGNHVYRHEIVEFLASWHLLLNCESGIVQDPLLKVVLPLFLKLYDEPRPVLRDALHIDEDILRERDWIGVLVSDEPDIGDVLLRENHLQREQQNVFPCERPLEPVVEKEVDEYRTLR